MSKRKYPPLFVIVACVVCAIALGFTCWNRTLRSDAEPTSRDYWFLLLYQLLSFISYFFALWFFSRLTEFRGTEVIVVLFLISVSGTIVTYVASSIQIWVYHQLELGWFLRQSAIAWLLLNVGMLILMMVSATAGFLLSLPFRRRVHTVGGM